ncbi:MAG: hypothetical protein IT457_15005 [Planctomycetes bacterium]|nr:hypothetical protein [Planctomycetota bacterium]
MPRIRPSVAALVLLAALGACREEASTLAEMENFHGELRIEIVDAGSRRSLLGQLAFDPARFVWTTTKDGQRVEFVREGAGGLSKLVDGKPAALAFQDELDFTLIWSLTRAELPPGAGTRRWDGGFAVDLEGRQLELHWRATPR